MDWTVLAILTLLIVAIVGFLALLIVALQYYTVTHELKEMEEDQEADRIARENGSVSTEQINDARETLISQEKK